MTYQDILLHLDSYPEPTPVSMIDHAVALAAALDCKLSALAIRIEIPLRSNRVADHLIGLSQLARDEERKSGEACRMLLEHFAAKAAAAGVLGQSLEERANLYEIADHVAKRARTRDLCIVPLSGRFDGQPEVAQSVMFNSGRPVLLFSDSSPLHLGLAVVAWDGSRCAARAMADALPILTRAGAVQVLTITGDRPGVDATLGSEAVRHLQAHGIDAVAVAVDAAGETAGVVLDRHLLREGADLLVMGSYGHSRLREFVLGGATEHVLGRPGVPVFMSH